MLAYGFKFYGMKTTNTSREHWYIRIDTNGHSTPTISTHFVTFIKRLTQNNRRKCRLHNYASKELERQWQGWMRKVVNLWTKIIFDKSFSENRRIWISNSFKCKHSILWYRYSKSNMMPDVVPLGVDLDEIEMEAMAPHAISFDGPK